LKQTAGMPVTLSNPHAAQPTFPAAPTGLTHEVLTFRSSNDAM
jgi:hypothetical protein